MYSCEVNILLFFFFLAIFVSLILYISNGRIMNWEGSVRISHGIFQDTVPVHAWKDGENHKIAGPSKYKVGIHLGYILSHAKCCGLANFVFEVCLL